MVLERYVRGEITGIVYVLEFSEYVTAGQYVHDAAGVRVVVERVARPAESFLFFLIGFRRGRFSRDNRTVRRELAAVRAPGAHHRNSGRLDNSIGYERHDIPNFRRYLCVYCSPGVTYIYCLCFTIRLLHSDSSCPVSRYHD